MTTEIIREIIDDLKSTQKLIEPEKTDMLGMLERMYKNECEPFKDEIIELTNYWD